MICSIFKLGAVHVALINLSVDKPTCISTCYNENKNIECFGGLGYLYWHQITSQKLFHMDVISCKQDFVWQKKHLACLTGPLHSFRSEITSDFPVNISGRKLVHMNDPVKHIFLSHELSFCQYGTTIINEFGTRSVRVVVDMWASLLGWCGSVVCLDI